MKKLGSKGGKLYMNAQIFQTAFIFHLGKLENGENSDNWNGWCMIVYTGRSND